MGRRVLKRVALALLACVLAALAASAWLATRGLPQREGSAPLPGLDAPVEVRFDFWGVPHMKAASAHDLAAAMGYVHANDRMTQLELGRRLAAGRLAEVVGEAALESDIEVRTLRLRSTAEQIWQRAGPESRVWLEAYAAGVNAWLDRHAGDLPPTLTLLGIRPEPWSPVDSLCFVLLMARDLSFWEGRSEEQRFRWLRRLGAARTRDLLGVAGLSIPILPELPAATEPGVGSSPGPAPGSNAWALGASRSTDSHPLLANDPHLALRLPGIWYQAHLRAPGYEAGGMTLPGLPPVVIGQNAWLAWGVTSLMLDDQDVFFEELDPRGLQVRRGDRWLALRTERQDIPVKGAGAHPLTLVTSDRGPLLPADPRHGLPARSLAWSAYLNRDPLAAFLHLGRARRVDEVSPGLDGFAAPAQNLIVADRDGGLLYTVLGELPRRRGSDGRLPAPGPDSAIGWDGTASAQGFARLRPAQDLLVSANDAGNVAQDPPVANFDVPARADRIRELLGAHQRWSAADLAGVQADVVSAYAREVVRAAAGAYPGPAGRAYAELAAWDGRMALRGCAALFALFERHLVAEVFSDELDLAEVSGQKRRTWLLRLLRGEMSEAWFDDRRTPELVEDRHQILERALAAAWSEGHRRWGAEVEAWPYGELHTLTLHHPLGALPVIGRFFDRGPYPLPGSATTVAAFGSLWKKGLDEIGYGPSMRWIAVTGDGDRSLAVLPGGQSGHPFDRHYDDQWPLYREGRLHAVNWSEAGIARNTVSTLRLLP